MELLKKYWWVLAFVGAGILLYWFMFRKEASTAPKEFVCNNTKAEWATKQAAKIAELKLNPTLSQATQDMVTSGKHATIEEAYASHSDWILRVQNKQCNPNYPLNSMDQFGV